MFLGILRPLLFTIGIICLLTETVSGVLPPIAFEHKVSHAAIGAIKGAAQGVFGGGWKEGAAVGAGAAVAAEVVAEGMASLAGGGTEYSADEHQVIGKSTKLFVAGAALATRNNVNIAYSTADTVIENNFLGPVGLLTPEEIKDLFDPSELIQQLGAIEVLQEDPTVIPLQDTYYREASTYLEDGIHNCYRARGSQKTPGNMVRIGASYGLDGLGYLNTGLDTVTLGGWSKFSEGLDAAANSARNVSGRAVRFVTKDQRTGQNVGDSVYLVLSLGGIKKILAPAQLTQKISKPNKLTQVAQTTQTTVSALDVAKSPALATRGFGGVNFGVDLAIVDLNALMGEYRIVKGHHVHAKKAFEGHPHYDPKKGFSISNEFMRENNIDHNVVTGAQKRLFGE